MSWHNTIKLIILICFTESHRKFINPQYNVSEIIFNKIIILSMYEKYKFY